MVQQETCLRVADNTDAKELPYTCMMGGPTRRHTHIDDVTVASVKGVTPGGVVKKSGAVEAIMVRMMQRTRRKDDSRVTFDESTAVIIKDDKVPTGTRISGPVTGELHERQFMKIVSSIPEVL